MIKSRDIPKILKEIAIKEFKNKRPDRLEIRRAKNMQILRRGFGPKVRVLKREKRIPYLMVLNYETEYRIYQISEDARIVGGQNYSKKEFGPIEKKIKKYTDIIYKIVRPKPKVITFDDIRNQINQDFHKIYHQVSKFLDIKIKNLPYISFLNGQSLNNLRFGIIEVKSDEIILSDEYLNNKLKIILYREVFMLFVPNFLSEKIKLQVCLLATFHFLKEGEKDELKEIWYSVEDIPYDLNLFNKEKILKIIKLILNFDRYNIVLFNEEESKEFLKLLMENLGTQNLNKLFSKIYKVMYSNLDMTDEYKKEIYLEYTICYYILAQDFDSILVLIDKVKNKELGALFRAIYDFDWAEIEIIAHNLKITDKKFKNLINLVIKFIRNSLIEVKLISPRKEIIEQTIFEIEVRITNKSKNTFNNLEIKKISYKPKNLIEIVEQGPFQVFKFVPSENIKMSYKFKALRPGKAIIKEIILSCRDMNDQIHEFTSNELNLIIKNREEI